MKTAGLTLSAIVALTASAAPLTATWSPEDPTCGPCPAKKPCLAAREVHQAAVASGNMLTPTSTMYINTRDTDTRPTADRFLRNHFRPSAPPNEAAADVFRPQCESRNDKWSNGVPWFDTGEPIFYKHYNNATYRKCIRCESVMDPLQPPAEFDACRNVERENLPAGLTCWRGRTRCYSRDDFFEANHETVDKPLDIPWPEHRGNATLTSHQCILYEICGKEMHVLLNFSDPTSTRRRHHPHCTIDEFCGEIPYPEIFHPAPAAGEEEMEWNDLPEWWDGAETHTIATPTAPAYTPIPSAEEEKQWNPTANAAVVEETERR